MAIITISRQSGSLGREITEQLSSKLDMQLITRERLLSELSEIANSSELKMLEQSPKFFLSEAKDGLTFKDHVEKKLNEEALKTPSIILGMGSQIIFSDSPDVLKVRIIASSETRIRRFGKKYGLGEKEALQLLQQNDKRHRKYIYTLYGVDWSDPLYYDLIINTDKMSVEYCVELISLSFEGKSNMPSINSLDDQDVLHEAKPDFKHPAEQEFANILNMYGIDWEYEPKTFPVKWDAEGNVTMAFSPDFYLTKFDTYIEITTMDQRYVTTKNKKVKLIRELYPGINITIVYKKDFYSLLERFKLSSGDEIEEFNRGSQ